MKSHFTDFLVATVGSLAFLLLGWVTTRGVFLGKPAPLHMRTTLVYGFFFILGMAYIMMIVSWMDWQPRVIYVLVVPWGALLSYLAVRNYRRSMARQTGDTSDRP